MRIELTLSVLQKRIDRNPGRYSHVDTLFTYMNSTPKTTIALNRLKGLAAYWGWEDVIYAIRLVINKDKHLYILNPILKTNVEQIIDYIEYSQLEKDMKEIYNIDLEYGNTEGLKEEVKLERFKGLRVVG